MSYAGDVDPTEAWKMLSENEQATLVDVRTQAEWGYVGVPDLSGIGKRPVLLQWQVYPTMTPNPDFVAALARALPDKDAPLLFICRSGARSHNAAMLATQAGYTTCYNVLQGFEGDKDAKGHRNTTGGWRASGLPWTSCSKMSRRSCRGSRTRWRQKGLMPGTRPSSAGSVGHFEESTSTRAPVASAKAA